MKRLFLVLALSLFLAPAYAIDSLPTLGASSIPSMPDAARIELAVRKLGVVGRVLYVGAHPDDENTAMLAWLSNGRLVRAAYLSMTRGDGGQNLIGTEKGDPLGVIRTEELLAARRIDGAEQFFARTIDFGYSRNPEETLRIWGHDKALSDVVWVVRLFRPDIIITRFPKTGEGGHGHHTASAILAEEAFHAAADPKAFPDQLKYVSTWQAKRIFWNRWRNPDAPAQATPAGILSVDLGAYNPLLGKSYTEIAADSRSMHKSQGFGSAERRGRVPNDLQLMAGDPASGDPLDGIDLTWNRVSGGGAIAAAAARLAADFDRNAPAASLPSLLQLHHLIAGLPESDPWVADVKKEKLAAVSETIREAAGLWVEAISTEQTVTAGDAVHVTATLVNRSDAPLRIVHVSAGAQNSAITPAELKNNQPWSTTITATVPADAPITQPYWLAAAPDGGTYHISDPLLIGRPENPSALPIHVTIASGDEEIGLDVPTLFRRTDPVRGEQYTPLAVAPLVTLNLDRKVYGFTGPASRKVSVLAQTHRDDVKGSVKLEAPAGWTVSPSSIPIDLPKKGEEATVVFDVKPSGSSTGTLRAFVTVGQWTSQRSLQVINYAHIPQQQLFPPSESPLFMAQVAHRGERIGYVMGAGDEVPEALRQMGYNVTLLSDEQLDSGNLGVLDSIVVGVRAFNTRERLKKDVSVLNQFVERGGALVVQYNTPDDSLPAQLGPYSYKISRDRVTVEDAPVTFLAPHSPLLNVPNRITQADFAGWVQERGTYFASEYDSHFTPVLSSHDPGEKDLPGGLIVAKYGKGFYIYTGYVFFRELPAGVPGAWRLFANLVSAGH
jgi:LmbE family N-acetylglucosaminyl deacetylase